MDIPLETLFACSCFSYLIVNEQGYRECARRRLLCSSDRFLCDRLSQVTITRSFRRNTNIMASSLDTDWDMDITPSPPPREDFEFADLDDAQELPLQKLIRYWMNERHAPDILPIQAELLAGILDHIHKQVRCASIARPLHTEGGRPFLVQADSHLPSTFYERTQMLRKMSIFVLCLPKLRSSG